MSAHRSPRGGEVAELARLLPVPAERDLPDGQTLLLREHLMAELHASRGPGVAERGGPPGGAAGRGWRGEPGGAGWAGGPGGPVSGGGPDWRRGPGRRGAPRGREPWWRIGMAGGFAAAGAAALAAAVAVGGASVLGPSPPGPSPYPTSFTSGTGTTGQEGAARLLSRVAGAAARSQAAAMNDRSFAYIESQVSFGTDGGPAPAQTHERQIWLPVADWCAGGLVIEHGERTSLKFPSSGVSVSDGNGAPPTPAREKCPDRGSLSDPTYRLLQSLPTDPQVLLHRIRLLKTGGRSPDAEAFGTIGDLIRESVMPPRVSAALYRAAALIPGVTVISSDTDAIGRPGVAVSLTVRGEQQEWIFDRHTYQLLGERDFQNGILVGKTAILGRAIVDRSGELPPGS